MTNPQCPIPDAGVQKIFEMAFGFYLCDLPGVDSQIKASRGRAPETQLAPPCDRMVLNRSGDLNSFSFFSVPLCLCGNPVPPPQ
jgi:hypothetical protein